jgi:hypothetical protein
VRFYRSLGRSEGAYLFRDESDRAATRRGLSVADPSADASVFLPIEKNINCQSSKGDPYMNTKILTAAFAASLLLAGCTSSNKHWVKDGTPRSDADQALADCKYEAEAATVGVGTNTRPKTWNGAVSDGIGDGAVRGMDEAKLTNSCMKAKGFAR